MQPYFGIAAADVGEQQHPREAPYVCSCLSLPCSRHPSKFDTTTLLLPHRVFSAWHSNLHSLSGWENPYWLELFGLLKQYPGHSFQRHLHDFSSCHRNTNPDWFLLPQRVSWWGTLPAGSNLACYFFSPVKRWTEPAVTKSPDHASFSLLFVFL